MVSGTRTRIVFLLITAAVLAVVVFGMQEVGYFSIYNTQLQDRLLDSRPASSEIVIVTIDDDSIQEIGEWPWKRRVHAGLIRTLAEAGAEKIVMDVTFSETSEWIEDELLAQAMFDTGIVYLASQPDLPPHPLFAEHAAGIGYANVQADADGIVRTVILGGSLTSAVLGRASLAGEYRIPFVGPPGSFTFVSVKDVRAETFEADTFAGKTVLVGATAPTLQDLHFTPRSFGEPMPGVEIHANILQGVDEGIQLRVLESRERFLLYLLLALFLALTLALLRLRLALLLNACVMLAYIIFALAMASSGLLLPVNYPIAILALVGAMDVAHRYVVERSKKRWVQDAFGYYLSPTVVNRLVSGETPLAPGGVKEELTILFSDIRGFTTVSEQLGAEQLVELLNEYLTEMTERVLETDGVLDKYIGDAVMAFWGAPLPQKDHAPRAARTALAMMSSLERLQEKWKKEKRPELAIGIGLNTGEVVVGNMGSKRRFDYTVIGDSVNLAARLESATKQYSVGILISESTRKQLGEEFVVRELDRVAVKGKKKPVTIFELVGEKGSVHDDQIVIVEAFAKALALYRHREWKEAKKAFEHLVAKYQDGPSEVFATRCVEMTKNDPGPGWDGVYVATSK